MNESLKKRAQEIFEKDQNQLDSAYKPQSPGIVAPEETEKVTVTENSDGTWTKNTEKVKSDLYDDSVVGKVENQLKKDAETLQEFCKEFDDRIISFNAQINAKKQQIVTLSTEAIGRNCWPGIAYSTINDEFNSSSGTTRETGIGLSATQNFGNDYSMFEDRVAMEIYKKMAGPDLDYGAENPFDPTSIVTLTSTNSGFGHENHRDNGRLNVGDDATEVTADEYNVGGDNPGDRDDPNFPPGNEYLSNFQSSTNLGIARTNISSTDTDHQGPRNVGSFRAYAGVGEVPDATRTDMTGEVGATRCVAIASSISTLISEIQTLRSQRDAAVNMANLNIIKEKKMEKELQSWGAENVKSKQTQRKASNSSAISALELLN